MEIDLTLCVYVLGITLMLISNTIFGIRKARKQGTFDPKILKDGIIDYFLIILGVLFAFAAGCILPEFKFSIPIIGGPYTIVDMLKVFALAVMIKYAIKIYNNIKEACNLTDEDIKNSLTCKDENKPVDDCNCNKPIEENNCISGDCSVNGNIVG